jgi:hypothetical protein
MVAIRSKVELEDNDIDLIVIFPIETSVVELDEFPLK